MRTARLEILRDFLENVPPEKFNMDTWGHDSGCGFAGCAVGWACQIPLFQELGLTLNDAGGNTVVPHYQGTLGYLAVTMFFNLDHYEARWLFDPTVYRGIAVNYAKPSGVTVDEVVVRINELLEVERASTAV